MRRFGLIGYPLSHSFSPAFFAEKFAREGIVDCTYEAYAIEPIEKLTELLKTNTELEGLNVTIPYKKQVIGFLDESTEAVKKMNACNCIKITNGKLKGYNTDVTGFQKSLEPHLSEKHKKALILGTGGAAAAVEYVLQQLNIEFLYVSRQGQGKNNQVRYSELNEKIIFDHKLIINTTPLGMYPAVKEYPDIPYQFITTDHYLFDLIYNPEETLFLKKGAAQGATIKNGSDMLIIQAEESWKIWNNEI